MRFEEKLENYARMAVAIGVGLQPGQRLLINAPIDAAPFVRLLAKAAYQRGARLVDVFWHDELLTLVRFEHAPRDSFAEVASWRTQAILDRVRQGDALLAIHAADPGLLKDQDPGLIEVARRAAAEVSAPFQAELVAGTFNWSTVSVPIDSWARQVFPEEDRAESRIARLWEAIFTAVRADREETVKEWEEHLAELDRRKAALNGKQYQALRFRGPGTDLTVGLPEGHVWIGGRILTKKGIAHIPNMPTEEIFTLPHKDRVDGTVQSSKPLSFSGRLIEDFGFRFEAGRIVEVWAKEGREALEKLVDSDEGARRLGEVALVPASSPISKLGILFYNTLFDENAASHLALGSAYRQCMEGGADLSEEDFVRSGGNVSRAHVDFMIGSEAMDVDGITADGRAEPIMRSGEWATP